jgi:hypothetical protein
VAGFRILYKIVLVFGRESTKDVMIEFLNQVIPDRTIDELDGNILEGRT